MPSPLRTPVSRLHVRRCLCCGYDGSLLKNGRAPRCARCGCDLRRRPALTYAEMEGFVEPQPKDARQSSRLNEAQVIERWLALLVAAVLVMVAAALLLTRDL